MSAVRRAEVVWEGNLAKGQGHVTGVSSGAFTSLPATWASRMDERAGGKTSPEELLAAAHATCFSMAFALELGRAGTPPERLETSAEVSFEKTDAGFRVSSSVLQVRGTVAGIDAARFAQIADAAKDGCPVSQALKGNVRLEVQAQLIPAAQQEQPAPGP